MRRKETLGLDNMPLAGQEFQSIVQSENAGRELLVTDRVPGKEFSW